MQVTGIRPYNHVLPRLPFKAKPIESDNYEMPDFGEDYSLDSLSDDDDNGNQLDFDALKHMLYRMDYCGNNICGGFGHIQNESDVKRLYNAGVRNVCVVTKQISPEEYKDNGIDCYDASKLLNMFDPFYPNSLDNKDEYKKELVDYIKFLQRDNVVLGCMFGYGRTSGLVALDYFFNPETEFSSRLSYNCPNLRVVKDLMNSLDENDKKELGWDSDFEQETKDRLNAKINNPYGV